MTERPEREQMETDVVIVGAGPAGLAAAIRLKQLAGDDIAVTVIEKAAEVGGHILSGAVMDPAGLDTLLPGWREKDGVPAFTPVTEDRMTYLTETGGFTFPEVLLPPLMKTPDGVIISLGEFCQWLASEAEALGVDIFPATAAVDVVRNESGGVTGIVTGDLGVNADGTPGPNHTPGIELLAKYTLIAEGARGSLAKKLIAEGGLNANSAPQTYSIGIKEIWEIPADRHEAGRIEHFMGWPLDDDTSGGGFLYHAAGNNIFVGHVTYLNYKNPTLSPFNEFQRLKTHPMIRKVLEGGTRISYGARALTSGGIQSVPTLAFPGGALMGCAAGFMNVPRLKGIHSAIRSGMATAEAVAEAMAAGRANDRLEDLQDRVLATGIGRELDRVRNVKPLWTRFGTRLGVTLAGVEMWANQLLGIHLFGRMTHEKPDYAYLKPISEVSQKTYARPDGELTFDRSASVYLANLAHDENQPVHLKLVDSDVPIRDNLPRYGEPAPLYCPAGVYELVQVEGKPAFRINAQNCVHCKTCDIKDPAQNINWVPPEGGSGPNYAGM